MPAVQAEGAVIRQAVRFVRWERGYMYITRRSFAVLAAASALNLGPSKIWASAVEDVPVPVPRVPVPVPVLSPSVKTLAERLPLTNPDYAKAKTEFLPQIVSYVSEEQAGTIVIDTDQRHLYFVLAPGLAKRYGIAVGREGFAWSGTATIKRKTKWPAWFPPQQMQARDREARRWRRGMPGGPRNPLGARALYLYKGEADTMFRIHGTRDPKSIGKAASSGCIRMFNADVMELYEAVPIGTKVVVLPSTQVVAQAAKKPARSRRQQRLREARRRERQRMRIAAYRRRRRRTLFGMFGIGDGLW
jgi:lipoprotein-anchoring transpeptidase ErfK/SrfK